MENRIDDPGLPPADREPDAGLPVGGPAVGGPAEAGPAVGGPAEAGSAEARPAGQRPVTDEPRVDAALARLDELPDLPVTEHRAVFEHVHRSLSEVLGELDTGAPPGPGQGERSGNAWRSGDAESRRG
jgi:hypothetical protein